MGTVKKLSGSKCDIPLSQMYIITPTNSFKKDRAEMKMWHCH